MPMSLIEQIRRMACGGAGLRDGELLGRFIERHDEVALAALVSRHGPMVWGVCRRLLRHHDAEDAFQATFIVLVKKASSIAHRELVGNWLYGVAHQTALQARRTAARRREVQVTGMPEVEAPHDHWGDLQPVLDQELSRLPDHYRAVIVLSDLEGKTRKEVAAQLGCPEGTMASRLMRARSMLAKRLARRGVALPGGALAAVLSRNASAGVPASVVMSTIRAASVCAAGRAAIPVQVSALVEGVLKAMLMSKLKAAVAVVLVLGLTAIGATALTSRTASAQGDKAPVAEEQEKAQLKVGEREDAATAWGEEVDGLQAGLVGARSYRHGEEVKPAIPADERQDSTSEYTTADIVVQYRDGTGSVVRDLKQFRVNDAATVAELASHFPGILGERGSGPRKSAGKRATFTIKFNHKSGEASQLRVAHVTADYATWWWRDNTPYTGDRRVEGKDRLQSLIEKLAAKNKVDLK